MKKVLIFCLVAVMSLMVVEAKPTKKIVTTIFTTDIHCPNCAKKVMNVLPYSKGVKDVVIEMEEKTIEVEFDAKKTDNEEIIKILHRLDVEATPQQKEKADKKE